METASSKSEFVYEVAEQLTKPLRNCDKTVWFSNRNKIDAFESELIAVAGKIPKWIMKNMVWEVYQRE